MRTFIFNNKATPLSSVRTIQPHICNLFGSEHAANSSTSAFLYIYYHSFDPSICPTARWLTSGRSNHLISGVHFGADGVHSRPLLQTPGFLLLRSVGLPLHAGNEGGWGERRKLGGSGSETCGGEGTGKKGGGGGRAGGRDKKKEKQRGGGEKDRCVRIT